MSIIIAVLSYFTYYFKKSGTVVCDALAITRHRTWDEAAGKLG